MSRRRERVDAHYTFVVVVIECRHHRGVPLGRVVRQHGMDGLEHGLTRLDGANGETTVQARCPACTVAGRGSDLQVRWQRLRDMLDALEREGRHADTMTV